MAFLIIALATGCAVVAYLVSDVVRPQFQVPAFVVAAVALLAIFVAVPLRVLLRLSAREHRAREQMLLADRERAAFDARLNRALGMAQTQEEALSAATRAVQELAPSLHAEVLLADSSRAHMARAATTHPEEPEGCGVPSPSGCPAVRVGHTLRFANSRSLDACPQLSLRQGPACAAVCVPMSMMSHSVGVLHAVTAVDQPLANTLVERLESVASLAGSRVELVTVIAQTQRQANTDSLTGLLNRRSLENEVRRLSMQGRPFALALADLDHFKELNDTYGHDMGDRALRLFSRTLRASVRELDLVARYGGEEFVVVFPDTTAYVARDVFDRVRIELAAAVSDGRVPPFTVSAGVADTADAGTLTELVSYADALLLEAKRTGRNRVLVSGTVLDPLTRNGWSAPTPPISIGN